MEECAVVGEAGARGVQFHLCTSNRSVAARSVAARLPQYTTCRNFMLLQDLQLECERTKVKSPCVQLGESRAETKQIRLESQKRMLAKLQSGNCKCSLEA